ncbi:MAG TPA: hypothetical protein VGK32_17035 [Vicinamibacterales bacterium]
MTVGYDVEMLLRKVRKRDGIAEAEQIGRGLRLWLGSNSNGVGIDEQITTRNAATHRIIVTVGRATEVLLREIRERDGISEAAQVNRGLQLWFDSQGFGIDVQKALRNAARLKARAEKLEEEYGPIVLVQRERKE